MNDDTVGLTQLSLWTDEELSRLQLPLQKEEQSMEVVILEEEQLPQAI